MYRFIIPFFLLCSASPLGACSCGGAIAYAPIVASPPAIFGKSIEIIETVEPVVLEESTENREIVQKVERPAIPTSIYPGSTIADEPAKTGGRKPLARLQIHDLPISLLTKESKEPESNESETQTSAKPSVDPPVVEDEEGKEEEGDVNPEGTHPPEVNVDDLEKNEEDAFSALAGQVGSRSGGGVPSTKPDPPGGPSDARIPSALKTDSSETEDEPKEGAAKGDNSDKEPEQGNQSLTTGSDTSSKSGGIGGVMDESQSWTVTVLVMLAALSTAAFLGMVLVVGEYRRRWLNAIMSQNGMPGFRGGLYDVPSISIGYGRYED